MKPRIGLTSFEDPQARATYVSLSGHYTRSIKEAGGIPFLIPQGDDEALACDYAANIDGLLLTGGKDIDPFFYGKEPAAGIKAFDAPRDAWELSLFSAAKKRGIPIFGICRGHQLINVAMGGTLLQDIRKRMPTSAEHVTEDFPVDRLYHSIAITEGSLLHDIFRVTAMRVNSFHHQAVEHLAPDLRATALAPDGIIEGFESRERGAYVLGVQFHPESLTRKFPEFLGLFEAFVKACAAR